MLFLIDRIFIIPESLRYEFWWIRIWHRRWKNWILITIHLSKAKNGSFLEWKYFDLFLRSCLMVHPQKSYYFKLISDINTKRKRKSEIKKRLILRDVGEVEARIHEHVWTSEWLSEKVNVSIRVCCCVQESVLVSEYLLPTAWTHPTTQPTNQPTNPKKKHYDKQVKSKQMNM